MIIQFTHPGTGQVVSREFPFTCPNCALRFSDPDPSEAQSGVDAPVTVHCIRCGVFVRGWSPPPPVPPPPPSRVTGVQRKAVAGTASVTTGQGDANDGWSTVAELASAALQAGEYELICSFELSLSAPAAWGPTGPNRTAQARLLMNGGEIATWAWPFDAWQCLGGSAGAPFNDGATPTFTLQLRRFGVASTARMRKARLELHPTATPEIDEQG